MRYMLNVQNKIDGLSGTEGYRFVVLDDVWTCYFSLIQQIGNLLIFQKKGIGSRERERLTSTLQEEGPFGKNRTAPLQKGKWDPLH